MAGGQGLTLPEAPPLLYVHGAWHGSWCWDDFSEFLTGRGFPGRELDFRGHAVGSRNRMWYRIHHYAADVAAAAASFPTMPILVAHSMGGLVVQRLLEEHTFPAVVLLAPVPVGGAWGATARAARRHPGAFLGANLRLRLWPIVGTEQRARNHLFSADLPEEEVRRHHKRLGDESWMAYIDMLLFARPRPSRVTAPPILVLAGEDDALFSVKEEAATARAYGADFVTVPGLAHDVMLDTRWPEAAAIVATWLESRFSPAVASP